MASVLETRSDCSRCAALCCIAYPSEEMPGFSAAKQAGQACPKLGSDGLCTIYTRRAEEGFAGCIAFECFGAGQHVVQHLFADRDWREDRAVLGAMVDAFLAMRPVSDLNFLAKRIMDSAQDRKVRAEAAALADRLRTIAASHAGLHDTAEIGAVERDLRALYLRHGR